jgi:hypothetical protein
MSVVPEFGRGNCNSATLDFAAGRNWGGVSIQSLKWGLILGKDLIFGDQKSITDYDNR